MEATKRDQVDALTRDLAAVRLERNMLRTLFQTPPSLFAYKDRDFIYRAVNRPFCTFLGSPEEEIIGRTDFDLFPRDEAEIYRRDDTAILLSGRSQTQIEEVTGNRKKRFLRVAKDPVVDSRGTITGILCTVIDVTLQRRAEDSLRESEERFHILAEATFEGIIIHDQGTIIDANGAFARLFGYSRHELIGRNILELAAPESHQVILKHMRTHSEEAYEAVGIRKDGTRIHGELQAKSLPYKGRIIRVAAARDITRRKQMEEEREQLVMDLRNALSRVKRLSGFLPICASCKKIRDDKGYWNQIEAYISEHSEAEFSHSICPECTRRLYPDLSGLNKDDP